MSAMSFREPDQARWIGVRPGHRGEQVAAHNIAINNTQIIHTVTAGKVLYLTDWVFEANAGAAGWSADFEIRNVLDVLVYKIVTWYSGGVESRMLANSLFYPIEVPTGYDIIVSSNAVGLGTFGFIHGWEEKA